MDTLLVLSSEIIIIISSRMDPYSHAPFDYIRWQIPKLIVTEFLESFFLTYTLFKYSNNLVYS